VIPGQIDIFGGEAPRMSGHCNQGQAINYDAALEIEPGLGGDHKWPLAIEADAPRCPMPLRAA
jgi:hypothetical protein